MISPAATSPIGFPSRRWPERFGWQIGKSGWPGVLTALAGTAVGFAVFLIFYLLGGMGGGDVKLMAGFGALLGAGTVARSGSVDRWGRRHDGGRRFGLESAAPADWQVDGPDTP